MLDIKTKQLLRLLCQKYRKKCTSRSSAPLLQTRIWSVSPVGGVFLVRSGGSCETYCWSAKAVSDQPDLEKSVCCEKATQSPKSAAERKE